MRSIGRDATILTAFALITSATGAQAQSVEEFYKGKTITIVTSTGPGGAYDLAARTISHYMGKYIPGAPQFVIKNMPGGGHVLATNYMYTTAPKDGTYIATVSNGIPTHQVLDGKGVRFDASKFNWLGSTGISNLLTVSWHTSPVKTISDVLKTEIITGATGTGSGTYMYPSVMNSVIGTKFKIVLGYTSSQEVDLAMERGEVAARSGASYRGFLAEHPDWIRSGKLNVLTQVGAVREPDLPNVPLMEELGRTEPERKLLALVSSPVALGRPYLTAPEVPADRVEALRRAFDQVMKDPEFLAEAKKLELDLNPLTGEKVLEIVKATIDAPPDILAKAKDALQSGDAK